MTILNPDLHLLTMDETKKLSMEVYVKRGRGYVPSDQHENERRKRDRVHRRGLASSTRSAAPTSASENTRVGQRTDYDRLTLDVETNGAIDPETRSLRPRRSCARTSSTSSPSRCPERSWRASSRPKHDRLKELFARRVDELELSVRSGNCLKASNIRTLGDLVQKSESEMLQFRNFGKKSLNEISDILQRHGLTFGMSVRRNPTSGDYEVQDREELRRLPDVQLGRGRGDRRRVQGRRRGGVERCGTRTRATS